MELRSKTLHSFRILYLNIIYDYIKYFALRVTVWLKIRRSSSISLNQRGCVRGLDDNPQVEQYTVEI
jgi:hypothetical protein